MAYIVSSYHEKIYLTQGFSYASDFYLMSLFITSYHSIIVSPKIYLTQGFSYTSNFYLMSLFITSYHSIIVSRKNISYSGLFIYLGFLSCHYSSLRIIVSSYHEKIYLTQGLSDTSDFYIMSLFITSYHSIIVSQKNISYSGLFRYLGFLSYVIIHHFVS